MALHKEIELDNGVIVNYHRIVAITKITNRRIILEMAGYINKEKRQQEIDQLNNHQEVTVYIDTSLVGVDYDEQLTIKDLYDYLKTTEKYLDAEDV